MATRASISGRHATFGAFPVSYRHELRHTETRFCVCDARRPPDDTLYRRVRLDARPGRRRQRRHGLDLRSVGFSVRLAPQEVFTASWSPPEHRLLPDPAATTTVAATLASVATLHSTCSPHTGARSSSRTSPNSSS